MSCVGQLKQKHRVSFLSHMLYLAALRSLNPIQSLLHRLFCGGFRLQGQALDLIIIFAEKPLARTQHGHAVHEKQHWVTRFPAELRAVSGDLSEDPIVTLLQV